MSEKLIAEGKYLVRWTLHTAYRPVKATRGARFGVVLDACGQAATARIERLIGPDRDNLAEVNGAYAPLGGAGTTGVGTAGVDERAREHVRRMRIRLLGPVKVWGEGAIPVEIGPRQQRFVLAVLALEAGRVVPADRLIDLLWPDGPPRTARTSLHVRVRGLRTALGDYPVVRTVGGGYQLDIAPDDVDAHRFRAMLEQARAEPDPTARADQLRRALELWHGPALADVTTEDAVRIRLVQGLEESRLLAMEDALDAELTLGHQQRLVDELTELAEAYPTRERFVRQLVLALHRTGQTSRALDVVRGHRARLAEEFGLDASAQLDELELAVLRADPELDRSPPGRALPVPSQLPASAGGFTGRHDALATLAEFRTETPGTDPSAAPVLLSGSAGVGKTALAVHWAHQIADQYPDGQLYVNLRGHAARTPLTPLAALGQLLRGLGARPDEVPVELDDAIGLYRSYLGRRRVLVVLDDAVDAAHVRPLLSPVAESLTIITSRDRMSDLVVHEGARRLVVGQLAEEEAHDLVRRLLGAARVAGHADTVRRLVQACARLPLALRVAVAQLLDQPHRELSDYVDELDECPLTGLAGDDELSPITAAFDLSYLRLGEPEQRLFRLLGLVPGPDVTPAAAAALGGTSVADASRRLARLCRAQLLEEYASGRYRFHDLLRDYARQRAVDEEEQDERDQAVDRLFGWYYRGTERAIEQLFPFAVRPPRPVVPASIAVPVIASTAAARDWLDAERACLVAAVGHAADHGPRHWAWEIGALQGYDSVDNGFRADAVSLARAGVRSAELAGADPVLAYALFRLGEVSIRVDLAAAVDALDRAIAVAERAGDLVLLGASLNSLGTAYTVRGDLETAADYLTRSLEAKRSAATQEPFVASTLVNLGTLAIWRGEFEEATRRLDEAATIYRRANAPAKEALALANLGGALVEIGRPGRARQVLDAALRRAGEAGFVRTQIFATVQRAMLENRLGHHADGLTHATEALERMRTEGSAPAVHEVFARCEVGRALRAQGRYEQSVAELERAREVCDRSASHASGPGLYAGLELAQTELARGRLAPARAYADEVLTVARRRQFRVHEAEALTVLAEIAGRSGDPADSSAMAEEALKIQEWTGQVLGQAHAARVLGEARHALGDDAAAEQSRQRASRLFAAFGGAEAATERALEDRAPGLADFQPSGQPHQHTPPG